MRRWLLGGIGLLLTASGVPAQEGPRAYDALRSAGAAPAVWPGSAQAPELRLAAATQQNGTPTHPPGGEHAAGGGEAEGPDAGTDPSNAKKRFVFYHEFYRFQNGFAFNTTTASAIFPILGGGGTVGLNIPFTYAELPRVHAFGIGDIYTRLILLPTMWDCFKEHFEWPFEHVKPFVGAEIYFPTAASDLRLNPITARILTVSLGTQKYRLAPLVGFAWAVNKHWSVIPVYFQDFSVAGNQDVEGINQGKLRLFVQYQDPSGWYFKPEFQVVTDYNDHARTELYIAPELGKVLKGGTVFYVKPGFGTFRNPSNREWGIEAGIRALF